MRWMLATVLGLLACGFPAAWAQPWVGECQGAPSARTLLFGVAPLDLPSLGAVALVVAAVVLAACALPARRAARLPAVAALRHE